MSEIFLQFLFNVFSDIFAKVLKWKINAKYKIQQMVNVN